MKTTQLTKRNRTATTPRLVDALEQILAEDGLEGVTIQALAEKAAVSKVLIYRYFGNIEGLVEYYMRQVQLVPNFSPDWLVQIQPAQPQHLAPIWSTQALRLFRQYRSSRAAREIIQASVKDKDGLTDAISKSLDRELSRLVNQLAFVKGADYQAISAVLLGALSYLTIQAQLDRPVISLDLRSEAGWQQIEQAVKIIFKALNQSVIDSPTTQLKLKSDKQSAAQW